MSTATMPADLHAKNKSLLPKQWFDYTPDMNAVLNTLHKRIFNLEITIQANSQISNRSNTVIDDNRSTHKTNIMITPSRNSMDILSDQVTRNDQRLANVTLEKQVHKSNLSSYVSFDETKINSITTFNIPLRSGRSKPLSPSSSKLPVLSPLNLTANQLKTRAYEFSAIFEDAFDQLIIVYKAVSTHDSNRNNNQFDFDLNNSKTLPSISMSNETNCNPLALNADGIFIMTERDKLRYEMEYFFHILLLFFRALLLELQTDFQTSVNNTHNHLSSIQLIELNQRLEKSQDQISKLFFFKKNFQHEKHHQLDTFYSTKSQLRDHLMEEKYRSKITQRYSNDWKKNHILQWIEMLLQIEQTYIKTIHQYENILKQTDIIHQETIEILIKQNNAMKLNANKWYEYYQNETYRFERELISFRQEFNMMKRQRQNMYEEYERMRIIVEEENQMKINEKLFREKEKQREDATKRIQAWWRGVMVRHMKQKRRKKKKKKK